MGEPRWLIELSCPGCAWSEPCGPTEIARRLAKARKVRPGREPELDVMIEVFRATAPGLACPRCGRTGLALGPANQGDWPEAVCSACSRPIPAERLEALPGTTLCADCQREAESGRGQPIEYCPKCGSPLALRTSRSSGLARYVMVCTGNPPCRLQ